MTYEIQMEMALQEMMEHPDCRQKLMEDVLTAPAYSSAPNTERPTGWWRKRIYRKKLIRRFLNHSPGMNLEEAPITRAGRGGYSYDFKNTPFDPHSIYGINRYEKLYHSFRGDIRTCKRRIIGASTKGYHIITNDIPAAKKYTNRSIRSKVIRMDDYIPSCPAHYKKVHSGKLAART